MQPGDDEPRDAWLVRLVVVLAVVAAGAIGTAVHYRSAAAEAGHSAPTSSTRTTQFHVVQPIDESLRVANARLPVRGRGRGSVVVIHGSTGASRSVVIEVEILGVRRGHRYKLIGNDCRGKVPDYVWATGRSDMNGTLHLATIPRSLDSTHVYWVSLYRPHALRMVGVFGAFAKGAVMPFQGGHGPCSL
jgi:hypothetical protein